MKKIKSINYKNSSIELYENNNKYYIFVNNKQIMVNVNLEPVLSYFTIYQNNLHKNDN